MFLFLFINRELKLLYSICTNENYIKIYDYNGDKLNEINTYYSEYKSSYSFLCDRKCLDSTLENDRFIRNYFLFPFKIKELMSQFKMKKIFHIIHQ